MGSGIFNRMAGARHVQAEAPANPYPIRAALDDSVQTLGRRARLYRLLVIAVITLVLSCVVVCLYAGSWLPLSGLLYLFAICAGYFWRDAVIVGQWRSQLLESWVHALIDVHSLRQGLAMNKALPEHTLAGMLGTLPSITSEAEERQLSVATRAAIAQAVLTVHACRTERSGLQATGFLVVVTALLIALSQRAWLPLLALLVIPLDALLALILTQRRARRLKRQLEGLRCEPEFAAHSYAQFAESLDWQPLSAAPFQNPQPPH